MKYAPAVVAEACLFKVGSFIQVSHSLNLQ